jgi:chemotaxis signal transduction protein
MTVRSCRGSPKRPLFPHVQQRRGAVVSAQTLLCFELDQKRFGVSTDLVREVQRAALPAALPNAPPVVRGLLNVRGELIPLMDLRAVLRLPARPIRASDELVICRLGRRTLCFAVDRVIELTEMRSELVIPDLAALLDADAELQLERALTAVA